MDFYPPLTPNAFFHIYNRGNNRENIFTCHDNYSYFLKKYDAYLSDCLDTFAFCLLPNHFHLLVRVKKASEWLNGALTGFKNPEGQDLTPEEVVSRQFRLFFMSYSKAINKQQQRVGSLFQKNFKRKQITSKRYFMQLVHYIHANPQLHGICTDFKDYPYSSYGKIIAERKSKLKKEAVLDMFQGKDAYREYHTGKANLPQPETVEGME